MDGTIRNAEVADVRRIVEFSEQKRTEYEEYQPIFWRKAHDSASAQKPYFEHLLTLDGIIALVYECEGTIQGFVIANLQTAPPVYGEVWVGLSSTEPFLRRAAARLSKLWL